MLAPNQPYNSPPRMSKRPVLVNASTILYTTSQYAVNIKEISIWEIAIKARLGRLQLPENPDSYLAEQMVSNAIQSLSITMQHAFRVYNLPDIHKDPFDRIIIAQALLEDMPILTKDDYIPRYGVQTVW